MCIFSHVTCNTATLCSLNLPICVASVYVRGGSRTLWSVSPTVTPDLIHHHNHLGWFLNVNLVLHFTIQHRVSCLTQPCRAPHIWGSTKLSCSDNHQSGSGTQSQTQPLHYMFQHHDIIIPYNLLRPPRGVHRAHLHKAYEPCFIRAVPPQTYGNVSWWQLRGITGIQSHRFMMNLLKWYILYKVKSLRSWTSWTPYGGLKESVVANPTNSMLESFCNPRFFCRRSYRFRVFTRSFLVALVCTNRVDGISQRTRCML